MRALVMDEFGGPLTIRDLPTPDVPPGAVLIDVAATGLCRSDWHAWSGHDDDVVLPHVPGHEFAGVVTELGEGVENWQVGDRVTSPFVEGCGQCEWCRSGNAQVCPHQQQPGFTHAGSFAEQVVIHAADTNLVAIPEGVGFEAAALLGCRFATAYRALTARARLQPQEWVTVVGAGGVGLSSVMIAKALGGRVVVLDRSPVPLATATELGADEVIQTEPADAPAQVAARIHELTGGGSHVSIDAVGSPTTAASAVLSLRRRGRHVQVGLLPSADGTSPVPMARVIAWELDVLGSHGMAAADYPPVLELVADGTLDPAALLAGTIGLAEAAIALPAMATSAGAGTTIIDPRR